MKKCQCGNTILEEYSQDYCACPSCKTLVSKHEFKQDITAVSSEEADLYGSQYWKKVMVREAGVSDLDELIDMYIPERATYWIKNLLPYLHLGEKSAEIGCGLGQLSYMLQLIGFPITDYELSPEICKFIEREFDLDTICGEFDGEEHYSNIIAMDVFEHLLDPRMFLKKCAKSISNNGVLVLQTPCYDPDLTYEEMSQKKPRFKHLLVPEQHVYIYSRQSLSDLLKEYGFAHIKFLDAYFGNDYDMFVIASKEIIYENSHSEINGFLNRQKCGRLVKGLIYLFSQNEKRNLEVAELEKQREQILKDEETLTCMVHEREKRICVLEENLKDKEIHIEGESK